MKSWPTWGPKIILTSTLIFIANVNLNLYLIPDLNVGATDSQDSAYSFLPVLVSHSTS
jgi:hypothetical protein